MQQLPILSWAQCDVFKWQHNQIQEHASNIEWFKQLNNDSLACLLFDQLEQPHTKVGWRGSPGGNCFCPASLHWTSQGGLSWVWGTGFWIGRPCSPWSSAKASFDGIHLIAELIHRVRCQLLFWVKELFQPNASCWGPGSDEERGFPGSQPPLKHDSLTLFLCDITEPLFHTDHFVQLFSPSLYRLLMSKSSLLHLWDRQLPLHPQTFFLSEVFSELLIFSLKGIKFLPHGVHLNLHCVVVFNQGFCSVVKSRTVALQSLF